MKYAVIQAGVVTNVVIAEAGYAAEKGWIAAPASVSAGWTYSGGSFAAPVTPLPEAKALKLAALSAKRDAVFAAGWTHDFGAVGIHTLDLRPDTDDKSNWTLLLIQTQGMIAAGGGAMTVDIRTSANTSIEVTATIANAAMIAFLAWGKAVLANKWAIDDAIQAAADLTTLNAIDIAANWP